jgi:hypothetical protein
MPLPRALKSIILPLEQFFPASSNPALPLNACVAAIEKCQTAIYGLNLRKLTIRGVGQALIAILGHTYH